MRLHNYIISIVILFLLFSICGLSHSSETSFSREHVCVKSKISPLSWEEIDNFGKLIGRFELDAKDKHTEKHAVYNHIRLVYSQMQAHFVSFIALETLSYKLCQKSNFTTVELLEYASGKRNSGLTSELLLHL